MRRRTLDSRITATGTYEEEDWDADDRMLKVLPAPA